MRLNIISTSLPSPVSPPRHPPVMGSPAHGNDGTGLPAADLLMSPTSTSMLLAGHGLAASTNSPSMLANTNSHQLLSPTALGLNLHSTGRNLGLGTTFSTLGPLPSTPQSCPHLPAPGLPGTLLSQPLSHGHSMQPHTGGSAAGGLLPLGRTHGMLSLSASGPLGQSELQGNALHGSSQLPIRPLRTGPQHLGPGDTDGFELHTAAAAAAGGSGVLAGMGPGVQPPPVSRHQQRQLHLQQRLEGSAVLAQHTGCLSPTSPSAAVFMSLATGLGTDLGDLALLDLGVPAHGAIHLGHAGKLGGEDPLH